MLVKSNAVEEKKIIQELVESDEELCKQHELFLGREAGILGYSIAEMKAQ